MQFKLADMATRIAASRALLHAAATAKDRGEHITQFGAMSKLMASETAASGQVLFAVPDASGRVTGLRPQPRLDPERITELVQPLDLLDSAPLTEASYQPAGWRILRRSHVT